MSCRASHNRTEQLVSIVVDQAAVCPGAGARGSGPCSATLWVWPRCSTIRRTPPRWDTICTAGPRTGVDLIRIRTHACAPYDLLAAHYQSLSIGMSTNTSIDLPVARQGVMCQVRHTHRLRNCSGKATDMRWISLACGFANWDDRMIPEVCLAHRIAGVV